MLRERRGQVEDQVGMAGQLWGKVGVCVWGWAPRASIQAENLSKLVTATTAGQGAFIQRSRDATMGSG